MKELKELLNKAFITSKARKWQDVRIPVTFIEKAKEIGLTQEEMFNLAINNWNKYVTQRLAYERIKIKETNNG